MKFIHIYGALLLASIVTGTALADNCGPRAAAAAGSRAGLERDRAAAIENEQRESASSSVIGKCVGGISSVVVVPTFPSLSDIFAQAANRVCRVASDKIRQASSLPTLGVPGMPTTSIPLPVTQLPYAPAAPAPQDTFWSRIWR